MASAVFIKKRARNGEHKRPKPVMDPGLVVEQANRLSSEAFLDMFAPSLQSLAIDCGCCKFKVKFLQLSEMTQLQRDALYDLTEKNMMDLYLRSSWGWDSKIKRDELFSPQSRHLVCYLSDKNVACANNNGSHNHPTLDPSEVDPCGFIHFRFEVDSKRPVLYCYEIQLRSEVRGIRLGQRLLEILYKIASNTCMTCVLLTVFKFNTPAYIFFGKNGFKVDKTDLINHKKFVDYSIMSRKL